MESSIDLAKRKRAKKQKSKTPVRGKRTTISRSLRRHEYIVYRDRRGQLRTPRSDLLLLAEVRSRKTGKRVGYLNKIENGKAKPRRFVSTQRAVLETAVSESYPDFESFAQDKDLSFTVYSNDMLQNQITREFYEAVMSKVRQEGQIQLSLDLRTNAGEKIATKGVYIDDDSWSYNDFVNNVVHSMLDGMNQLNIRMSPKKFAKRRKGVTITRAMHVRVGFAALD